MEIDDEAMIRAFDMLCDRLGDVEQTLTDLKKTLAMREDCRVYGNLRSRLLDVEYEVTRLPESLGAELSDKAPSLLDCMFLHVDFETALFSQTSKINLIDDMCPEINQDLKHKVLKTDFLGCEAVDIWQTGPFKNLLHESVHRKIQDYESSQFQFKLCYLNTCDIRLGVISDTEQPVQVFVRETEAILRFLFPLSSIKKMIVSDCDRDVVFYKEALLYSEHLPIGEARDLWQHRATNGFGENTVILYNDHPLVDDNHFSFQY